MRVGLFVVLQFFAFLFFAQERIVNYRAQDKELSQVFKELEKEYGVHFAYSVEEVKRKRVNIEVERLELSSFLDSLLTRHQLTYEIISNDFISVTRPTSIFLRLSLQDVESAEQLAFATARIKGTTKGYISDVNGIFEIVVPDPKETILEISFLGYKEVEVAVDELDPTKTTDILLERDATQLQEVVVKEYLNRGITMDDRVSRITINVQEVEILPGLSERDILLSTQLLPGISSIDESAAGLNVRGSSRDNTFIYWNNIPMYHSAHYFGNISSFIPSMIGKVGVYKNFIPVEYGGSSAGLLLMDSRDPKVEGPGFETNLNLTHGDLYGSVPFAKSKGSISIAGRRSHNDLFITPTFNTITEKLFAGSITEDRQGISEDFEYNSKLIFSDLNLNLSFKPGDRDELSVSAIRSKSDLNYDSQDETNEVRSIQTHNLESYGANFSWEHRWSDHLSSKVSTSYSDYHLDYYIENRDEGVVEDSEGRSNDLENLEVRITGNYSPSDRRKVSFGYQYNFLTTSFFEFFPFADDVELDIDLASEGGLQGFFVDYLEVLENGLQIGVGGRINRYLDFEESRIDRQLRINYRPFPELLFKSTAGVYHQYLSSLKEVEFVFSNAIEQNWVTADEELEIPITKNEQVVLGTLYTKAGWVIDLDAYRKKVTGPVGRNFGLSPANEEIVVSGVETIWGLDFMLKKKWKFFNAWLSYTFQDSEVAIIDESPFPSSLNLRHQFQFTQVYKYKQFDFSVGYTMRSGAPYTIAFVDGDELFYEAVNSSRLPTYRRLDASMWYHYEPPKEGISLDIGISLMNVFNRNNLFSRTYGLDDEEDEFFLFRRDLQLIGISPNLSVRVRF